MRQQRLDTQHAPHQKCSFFAACLFHPISCSTLFFRLALHLSFFPCTCGPSRVQPPFSCLTLPPHFPPLFQPVEDFKRFLAMHENTKIDINVPFSTALPPQIPATPRPSVQRGKSLRMQPVSHRCTRAYDPHTTICHNPRLACVPTRRPRRCFSTTFPERHGIRRRRCRSNPKMDACVYARDQGTPATRIPSRGDAIMNACA